MYHQDEPLKEWRPLAPEYLEELLRLEGRGEFDASSCPLCVSKGDVFGELPAGVFRCQECFVGELLCAECCIKEHALNPLHVIEVYLLPFTSNLTWSLT